MTLTMRHEWKSEELPGSFLTLPESALQMNPLFYALGVSACDTQDYWSHLTTEDQASLRIEH